MIHESGAWSDTHKSWFFLPRRCSKNRYNETTDETMSCNVLLSADENFVDIKVHPNSGSINTTSEYKNVIDAMIFRSLKSAT